MADLLSPRTGAAALERLFPEPDPHLADPVGFVRERLGAHLWSRQRAVADAVRDHRHVAVPSAHGVGKSFTAARLAAWWIGVHPLGEAFVLLTAPTAAQVSAVLVRELRVAHAAGRLPGVITQGQVPEWKVDGQLVALGRSAPDHDPSHLQGIHARYLLVVIDEACGVEKPLWDAVESLATSEHSRILAIGNPDSPGTRFEDVCKPGSGWRVLPISALDAPAFTGEQVPDGLRHLLVGPTWVSERKRRWGEASPIYQSKVLGQFPDLSEDALVSPAWVAAAQRRELTERGPVTFGVDVARMGPDETVIYRVQGGRVRMVRRAGQQETMATAGMVAQTLHGEGDHNPTWSTFIDAVGVGAGVFDRLRELGHDVTAFNAAAAPADRKRFGNRRAEAFWHLREAFEKGEVDIDPADEDLAAQLVGLRFRLDSKGRIFIESKDDMRRRGLPSPDRADALSMCWRSPDGFASPRGHTGCCDRCGISLWGSRLYWLEVANSEGRWEVCIRCWRRPGCEDDQVLKMHDPPPPPIWERQDWPDGVPPAHAAHGLYGGRWAERF